MCQLDLVAGQRFEVADVERDAELLPRGDSQCRLGCGWAERGSVDGDLLRSIEDRQRLQIVGLDALPGEGAAVGDGFVHDLFLQMKNRPRHPGRTANCNT